MLKRARLGSPGSAGLSLIQPRYRSHIVPRTSPSLALEGLTCIGGRSAKGKKHSQFLLSLNKPPLARSSQVERGKMETTDAEGGSTR